MKRFKDFLIYKSKYITDRISLMFTSIPRSEKMFLKYEKKIKLLLSYLDVYEKEFSITPIIEDNKQDKERIFSLWLQGKDNAPNVVRSCLSSIQTNCSQEVVILDEKSLWEWIDLPEHIIKKWKQGKIRPAHFADICRLELLYRYGGIWADATCFITSPIPKWVMDEDFFVYMSGDDPYIKGSYSFIQNCFIRAKKGSILLAAWRNAVLKYWENEDIAIDYFIHQVIFKKVVGCNASAAEAFKKMPKIIQTPTHSLWFGYGNRPFDEDVFESITRGTVFQKIRYSSPWAKNPIRGSFAEKIIQMYK